MSPTPPHKKGAVLCEHPLSTVSPYAQKYLNGWQPAEAAVSPNQMERVAGTSVVNNTYLPAPLKATWSKTRELSPIESPIKPKPQAPDMLWTAKGMSRPRSLIGSELTSVRPAFSASIPIYKDNYDVFRFETGFLRSPCVNRGASPAPLSPVGPTPMPYANANSVKFTYDKQVLGTFGSTGSMLPVHKSWL